MFPVAKKVSTETVPITAISSSHPPIPQKDSGLHQGQKGLDCTQNFTQGLFKDHLSCYAQNWSLSTVVSWVLKNVSHGYIEFASPPTPLSKGL